MEEKSEQIVFRVSPEIKKELEEMQREKYVDMPEEEVVKKLVELGLKFWEIDPELCGKLLR